MDSEGTAQPLIGRARRWTALAAAATLAAALLSPLGGTTALAESPSTLEWTSPGSSSWTVPAGVHSIALLVAGGEGGRGGTDMGGAWGGTGAVVTGTLDVTPGETLQLQVASRGGNGATGSGSDSGGAPGSGWTDGGRGGNGSRFLGGNVGWGGGGGGGSSAVVRNGSTIAIAGGGGGGGGRAYCDGNPGGNGGESGRKVSNSCSSDGGDPGLAGESGNADGLAGENGGSGAGQGGGGGGGAGRFGGGGGDHSSDGGGGGGGGTSTCAMTDCDIGVGQNGNGRIQIMPVHTPVVEFDETGYSAHVGNELSITGTVATQHTSGGIPEGTVTLEASNDAGETSSLGDAIVDDYGAFSLACTVTCGIDISDVTTVTAHYTSVNPQHWTAAAGSANLTLVNAETQTNLFVDPSTAVTGQLRDVTATVSVLQPALGAVHGDVEFWMSNVDGSGAELLGTSQLAPNYQAKLSAGVPEATDKRFWAVYIGVTGFNGSESPKQTIRTDVAETEVWATTAPNPTVTGQDFELAVEVLVQAPGAGVPSGEITVISAEGTTVETLDAAGAVRIPIAGQPAGELQFSIAYEGDDNFAPSVTSVTHTVERAAVDLTLDVDRSESVYGESITLTSEASAVLPGQGGVTGELVFGYLDEDGAYVAVGEPMVLEDGAAETEVQGLDVGHYMFEARYAQTDDFLAAVSPRAEHDIVAAETTVTVEPQPEVNAYSLPQEVVIQVLGPDALPAVGHVDLLLAAEEGEEQGDAGEGEDAGDGPAPAANDADPNEPLASEVLLDDHGTAVVTLDWLEPGTYEVFAVFGGSENFLPAESEAGTFVIEQAVSKVTLSGEQEVTVDQEETFVVNVGAYESVDAESALEFSPTGTLEVRIDGESVMAEVELTEQTDGSYAAVATVAHTFTEIGSYRLTAHYSGDDYVFAGESAPLLVQALAAPKDDDSGGSASGRGDLPRTGADAPGAMLGASALLLLAGLLVLLRRRRLTGITK